LSESNFTEDKALTGNLRIHQSAEDRAVCGGYLRYFSSPRMASTSTKAGVRLQSALSYVTPAKAGVQLQSQSRPDSRFRGNDSEKGKAFI
jgi:hypothetical protein